MDFNKIKKHKISILGGGWLGYPLAQTLSELGAWVNLATRSQQRLDTYKLASNVESFLIDIENLQEKLQQNIAAFLSADILIVNITNKNIPAFAEFIHLIEKSSIKHVMFISSTSVYPDNNSIISEDDGIELTDHPLSQIENLFKQAKTFTTTVVRFSGLIGYERHPGRFFRNGKTIKNAQAKVNLIHRDDCLNILVQIINDDVWGESFNVCSDAHPNKQEFYTYAAESLGVEPAKCDVETTPLFKIIDNTKIKNKLNYQFIYPDVMALDFSKVEC
ncbi:dTDP-glucose 4,6-dehydratase [uncultured Psychrosphaera sp.]|uniref:dTDP-glucose 4,6-dehydratase n=1 Tax=uncultured Psychrosphaera sp. TaxID=1403522 RepID=UPI002628A311|nr:dTDP-glucose 4,6-dehydratase [uncultured Psychrosphaera sp.]